MFEELFVIPAFVKKYQTAPLAEQRAHYLRCLQRLGARRSTLRRAANAQLSLIRLLDLQEGSTVTVLQVEAAAAIWARPKERRCKRAASLKVYERFVSFGIQWLRFLGWLDEPVTSCHPHHAEATIFEGWLRAERGLSEATIQSYRRAADHFFIWLAERGITLSILRMVDVDAAIMAERKRGCWNRRTIHDYAQRLKAFFIFAEARGWCRSGLAAGIMVPGFMADETIPKGLPREDVLRLLASVQGDRPVDKRDRAVLMLFIAYGLRAGEVAGLQLDDLDWENERLRVRCPKPGRTHLWPLTQSVGQAILSYVRNARPTGFGRSLFFTSCAPIRPLDRKSLSGIVASRLANIGIIAGRRGPHALRHAAAQHLSLIHI